MLKKLRENGVKLRDISPERRLETLVKHGYLNRSLVNGLQYRSFENLTKLVDRYAENVIGCFPMAWGVAEHFKVNGLEIPGVPMVTEEATVIAAASKAAKMATRGFTVKVGSSVEVGHAFFPRADIEVYKSLEKERSNLLGWLRENHDTMQKYGGGINDLVVLPFLDADSGLTGIVVRVYVDVVDAMGANITTKLVEALAKYIEANYETKALASICSNISASRTTVRCIWPREIVSEEVGRSIIDMQTWAKIDLQRAVTHNKGVMNGITAVCLATGQDTRAVEAAIHVSSFDKKYKPLTSYEWTSEGLYGKMTIPLPVGTVGGATTSPFAELSRELMGVKNREELASVIAAVGLAQNFAALYSLVGEGISEAKLRIRKS